MMRPTKNRCQCLLRGQFATRRKRAVARQMALASFLSSALISGITGESVIAADDLQGILPTAEAMSSDRSGSEGPSQVNAELARRASEFGQRMRDRFFKAPAAASSGVTTASALETPPVGQQSLSNDMEDSEEVISANTSLAPSAKWTAQKLENSPLRDSRRFPNLHAKPAKVSKAAPSPAEPKSPANEKRASVWQSPVYLRPRAIAKNVQPPPEPEEARPAMTKPEIAAVPAERPELPDPASSPTSSLTQFQIQLKQKFPTSDIRLQWLQSSLVVSGTVADAQQAIQLMAFVRKSYLVPVVDRLEVPRGNSRGGR